LTTHHSRFSFIRTFAVVVLSFAAYYFLNEYFGEILKSIHHSIRIPLLSYFLTYFIVGLPVFIGTVIIHKSFAVFSYLGIGKGFIKGIFIAFLFTLPMLIGGLVSFPFAGGVTFDRIIKASLFAGFFEELYFRGFLFGQIFRYTKCGFIPSILLGAILFASGHLYQSNEFTVLVGIFLTTFMGAVFFAWLFAEWNYNLWLVIFLHAFMNLSWELFAVSDNALGDLKANIFRTLTIAVAIIGTILYKRRNSLKMEVNKRTLLWKSS